MRIFANIDLDCIISDSQNTSTESQNVIYDHLKYYFSLSNQLPGIGLKEEDQKLCVSNRFIIYQIAKELEITNVPVVITNSNKENSLIQNLIKNNQLVLKDLKNILETQDQNPEIWQWEVYFFEEVLNDSEKKLLENEIQSFFTSFELISEHLKDTKERVKDLIYGHEGVSLAFRTICPVGNRNWASDYVNFLKRLMKVKKIVSINGEVIGAAFPRVF